MRPLWQVPQIFDWAAFRKTPIKTDRMPTREEMAKAIDMGGYYRIPCDNRDLNYDKFFTEGDHKVETVEEYHSHNTKRLDVEGMKELLLKLNFIREDLGLQPRAKARDYRSE